MQFSAYCCVETLLTYDGHQWVEVTDVDALLGDVDEVLDHAHSIALLEVLQARHHSRENHHRQDN